LGGKQTAGKQRICKVSQVGMQKVAELENEAWQMNLAAPKEGLSDLL
jgi:hypothetical protein